MYDGIYAENVLNFKTIRPNPVEPQEVSGINIGQQAIYRYSLQDSDYPVLTIVDKIKDADGNQINEGHYELALSDEHDFFVLMQSKKPVAIIPVFKVEEDKSAFKKPSKELQKIQKKKEKEREETNKKRAKKGLSPDIEPIFMRASIEYIKNGDYYLIEYEKGAIRAWGAIKF